MVNDTPASTPRTLHAVPFGDRYTLRVFLTRFDTLAYFVVDSTATTPGGVIRQADTAEAAVSGLPGGDAALADLGCRGKR